VIYDDLVRETLIEPLRAQRTEEVDPPSAGHDAVSCPTCQAWLAHVRDAEHS
jgi:hypothetical protein